MNHVRVAIILACAALSATASAAGIHAPRATRPAVVLPGGGFPVSFDGEFPLYLESQGATHALSLAGVRQRGERREGIATLPGGVTPGRYDLVARGREGAHVRRGAVHVLPVPPEAYTLAVVRGMADPAGGPPALPEGLGAQLGAAGAALAIVFNVGPESPELETAILSLPLPAFVCPEGADEVHAVSFGPDGYLFLGGGLPAADASTHGRLGAAHEGRRAIRASRWSFGVCRAYGLDWDVRAQMVLFVDDPLNFLIADSAPAGLGGTVPWGRTEFVFSPEMPRGVISLLQVDGLGIAPHAPAPEETLPEPTDQVVAPAAG